MTIDWKTAEKISNDLIIKEDFKFSFIIIFIIHTGLKINEIIEIKWVDILNKEYLDLNENKIYINKILQERINFYNEKIKEKDIDNYIFINKNNTKLSTQYINMKLNKIAKHYKIDRLTTNLLRKLFGIEIYKKSNYSYKTLLQLSKFYNHANTISTKKYLLIIDENINQIDNNNFHKLLEKNE